MTKSTKTIILTFSKKQTEIPIPNSYDDLLKKFLTIFEQETNPYSKNSFSLTYLDETNEECLINCDEDYKMFLELLEKIPNNNIIKGTINLEDSVRSIQSKENINSLIKSSINNLNLSENNIYNEISEMKNIVDDLMKKDFSENDNEKEKNEIKNKLELEKIELENKYKNELEEKDKYYKEELSKMENKIKQLSEDNQKSYIQIQEFNKTLEKLDEQKKNNEQKLNEEKQILEKENKYLNELIKKNEENNIQKIKAIELKCEKQIQETIKTNSLKNDEKKKSNEDLTRKIIEEISKTQNEMLLQIQKSQKNMEEEIKKLKQESEKKDFDNENIIKELKENEIKRELENQKLREEIQNLKSIKLINKQKEKEEQKKEGEEKETEKLKNNTQNNIKEETINEENSLALKSSVFKNQNNLDQKESIINQDLSKNQINFTTEQSKEFQKEINKLKSQYLEELNKKYKSIANKKISEFMKNLGEEIKTENDIFLTNILGKMEEISSKKENKEPLQLSKILENKNDRIFETGSSISTVHKGIKCSNCGIDPIIGIRYKCLMCDNFNLCEKCEKLEDNNINSHPHNLIKMRKEEKKLKNLNNKNLLYFENDILDNFENNKEDISKNNNNYEILKEDEKSIEKKTSYETDYSYNIKMLKENYDVYEGSKFVEVYFEIENNGKTKYEKGKMSLKLDEYNSKLMPEIKCIPIVELGPCEKQEIKLKYSNLELTPPGNYPSYYYVEYDGKNITEKKIKINIRVLSIRDNKYIRMFIEKFKIK